MGDLKMPDINTITIAGNLTRDPTLRTTSKETPVANFPIVYSKKYKDNSGILREEVCYIGIVAWHKLAESCHENLSKGSAVLVEGELQSKNWKMDTGVNRTVVEIKAKRIQFLNKKSKPDYIEDESSETLDSIGMADAPKLASLPSDEQFSDQKPLETDIPL